LKSLSEVIEGMTPKAHALITLSWFAEKTGRPADNALYAELEELSRGQDGRLEMFGLYTAPSGENYEIAGEDFAEYLKTGKLVCPEEGEIIDNPGPEFGVYWACREEPSQSPNQS
jgi:hypothetical protein